MAELIHRPRNALLWVRSASSFLIESSAPQQHKALPRNAWVGTAWVALALFAAASLESSPVGSAFLRGNRREDRQPASAGRAIPASRRWVVYPVRIQLPQESLAHRAA